MKNYLVPLMFAVVCAANAQQSPKVTTDEEMSFVDAHFQDFLSVEGEHFYTFGSSDKSFYREKPGRNFYLAKYKMSDFSLVEEIEIEAFKYQGAKVNYHSAFANKAGFHLLTECFHKKLKTKFLLHLLVDREGKVSEVREVASMECRKPFSRKFLVTTSEDHTKTMVYSDLELWPKDDEQRYIPHIWVYNENFSENWDVQASLGLEDKTLFYPTGLRLSNDGEALILGYQRKAKILEKNVELVDQYSVLRHNEQQRGKVYTIDTDEMMVHHMRMDVNPKGMIQLVGMSSEIGGTTPDGSVFIQMNPKNMKPELETWTQFDTAFLGKFPGAFDNLAMDFVEENFMFNYHGHQKKLRYFRIMEIVNWEDGGVTAMAERVYGRGYTYIAGSSSAYTHFDEIIVINFSSEGKIEWTQKIPKFQMVVSANDGFGSFYTHVADDEINLIYNDDAANPEHLKNGTEIRDFGGTWGKAKIAMVVTTIGREGQMHYDVLYDDLKKKSVFYTDECFQVGEKNNLGIIASPGLSRLQFVKIKFP